MRRGPIRFRRARRGQAGRAHPKDGRADLQHPRARPQGHHIRRDSIHHTYGCETTRISQNVYERGQFCEPQLPNIHPGQCPNPEESLTAGLCWASPGREASPSCSALPYARSTLTEVYGFLPPLRGLNARDGCIVRNGAAFSHTIPPDWAANVTFAQGGSTEFPRICWETHSQPPRFEEQLRRLAKGERGRLGRIAKCDAPTTNINHVAGSRRINQL